MAYIIHLCEPQVFFPMRNSWSNISLLFRGLGGWPWIVTTDGFNTIIVCFPTHILSSQTWNIVSTLATANLHGFSRIGSLPVDRVGSGRVTVTRPDPTRIVSLESLPTRPVRFRTRPNPTRPKSTRDMENNLTQSARWVQIICFPIRNGWSNFSLIFHGLGGWPWNVTIDFNTIILCFPTQLLPNQACYVANTLATGNKHGLSRIRSLLVHRVDSGHGYPARATRKL